MENKLAHFLARLIFRLAVAPLFVMLLWNALVARGLFSHHINFIDALVLVLMVDFLVDTEAAKRKEK